MIGVKTQEHGKKLCTAVYTVLLVEAGTFETKQPLHLCVILDAIEVQNNNQDG